MIAGSYAIAHYLKEKIEKDIQIDDLAQKNLKRHISRFRELFYYIGEKEARCTQSLLAEITNRRPSTVSLSNKNVDDLRRIGIYEYENLIEKYRNHINQVIE